MSIDPDYAGLPPKERMQALGTIHYGKDYAPKEQEGFFHHAARVVGGQIGDLAKSSIAPYTEAYKGYEAAKGHGKGTGTSLAYGAAMGMNQLVGDPVGKVQSAMNVPQEYAQRRQAGYNPVYAAAAPAVAPQVGVNLPSMEHQAEIGNTRGVLAEAAVPAAETLGAAGALKLFEPGGAGARALESRRLRAGPQNIIEGLDTPAGKGGDRALQMKRDVHAATGDLAEIGREVPSKVTRMLSREGTDSEALHGVIEKIDQRLDDMWTKGHEPGIERHAQADTIGRERTPLMNPVADAAQAALTRMAKRAAPGEAATAQAWVDQLRQPTTLKELDEFIRHVNDDLKGKGAETRYGPLSVTVRNEAVKAARNTVDRVLMDADEAGVKAINRRWGALDSIRDRLTENAVNAARKEAKGGSLPDWAHLYGFLHPDLGLSVGVGVNAARMMAPSMPSKTLRGMVQLGKTSLTAPYEAVPPPGWNQPPAGLLPPPAPQVPPNATPDVSGVRGVPAPRQTYRDVNTGRMARGYTGEMPPIEMGRTAEGGPMYEAVPPRFEPPRVEQRRQGPFGQEPKYVGTERRVAGRGDPGDLMRTYRMDTLKQVIDDPTASARDKAIAREQLKDMEEHPLERTNPAEVDVAKAKAKNEKKLTRAEAAAETERRKAGRNKRFKKED